MDPKCEALLEESAEKRRDRRPALITAASCNGRRRAIARRAATVISEQA